MIEISQPLSELDWIPRPRLLALRRLEINTVDDLLNHFPRRYEDRHEFPAFPSDESDTPMCLCGEVVKTQLRRFGGWKKIFEATIEERNATALSQPLVCRWFNLHYVQKMIATGQQLVVFGKPRLRGKRICIDHPEFEVVEDSEAEKSIHFRRITPVYPATEGLSQRVLRSLIYRVLAELSEAPLTNLLPATLSTVDQRDAISHIHFPETWPQRDAARRHLVLCEFFAMQMLIGSRRVQSAQRPGRPHCGSGELLDRFVKALPFQLTSAQLRVLSELRRDLKADQPMSRLLQGDVGSGKTVVAVAAMLLAVEAGYQAALMAPTQVLAEQHYSVLRDWLESLGIRVALRTGARQEESGPLPLFEGSARVSRVGDGVTPSRTFDDDSESLPGAEYHRRRLPHFEKPWALYAVAMGTKNRRTLSPNARTVVLNALTHFHNERYELFAACVMPDHVHFLIQPWPKGESNGDGAVFWSLSDLIKSVKSFSAHQINKIEKTTGSWWEKERFDRYIRSDRDLEEKFQYIVSNPWKAGLVHSHEDYEWVWTQGARGKSSSRRDDATNTRDACATQQQAGSLCSPIDRATLSDGPHIIVGTHALLYDSVQFSNLGFVVIDEQHKFGVAQRARLTDRKPAPDVLVMTATPIPRTITMTVYGDLDVSVIDEMPRNRGKIVTAVRDQSKLPEVLTFIRGQLERGRQLYVIYPLIDESDKLEAKAAAVEYEKWRERLHPFRCELLHGRIPAADKQTIMNRFRRGETHALVSTTVIEVGIDVPNATVMLIENAERFGLAQLHQLRGRIGRGEHKSFCILLTSDQTPETVAKLGVLEKTTNGFEIADADWELRGPGDLLGTAQSGLPPLKLGDLRRDAELMKLARSAALKILETDSRLRLPENKRFASLTVELGKIFSNVS